MLALIMDALRDRQRTVQTRLAAGPVETVLRDALHRIEKHGHIKGEMGDYSVGYCAEGALGYACDVLCDDTAARAEAGVLLERVVGWPVLHLWNDHPLRTQQEVTDALNTAIAIAAKENR